MCVCVCVCVEVSIFHSSETIQIRYAPGNYTVDVPSLFATVFDLLAALMLRELDRIQFKVGVGVQVKKCIVIDVELYK